MKQMKCWIVIILCIISSPIYAYSNSLSAVERVPVTDPQLVMNNRHSCSDASFKVRNNINDRGDCIYNPNQPGTYLCGQIYRRGENAGADSYLTAGEHDRVLVVTNCASPNMETIAVPLDTDDWQRRYTNNYRQTYPHVIDRNLSH